MSDLSLCIISPGAGRYRFRLPGDFAEQLGWPREPGVGFQCFGFFRAHGELLCSPEAMESPVRATALRSLMGSGSPPESLESFAAVPDIASLMTAPRVIEFRSIWLKPPHTQLELQLSAANLARLGWHGGSSASLVALAYSRVLILLSEKRYADAHVELNI